MYHSDGSWLHATKINGVGGRTADDWTNVGDGEALCGSSTSVRVYHNSREAPAYQIGHHCKLVERQSHGACRCKCNKLFRNTVSRKPLSTQAMR